MIVDTALKELKKRVELLEDEDVPEADRRRFGAQLRTQVRRLEQLATEPAIRAAVEQGDPGSSVKRISVVAQSLSNAIASARALRSVH